MEARTYEVIVIGGGPAGLAAAMWLARYRRSVLLVDARNPRNAETWAVHGYLGLDDVPPFELRSIGRKQAEDAGAHLVTAAVESVSGEKDDFRVRLGGGRELGARRLVFCTGLRDIIPEIPGLVDFYGTSIWHCPDCDGPSVVGRRVGVIGWGRKIAAFCMYLLTWTDRIVVFTHGHSPDFPPESSAALERFGIPAHYGVIERLEGDGDQVRRVFLRDGGVEEVDAMFFHIASGPGSSLPPELGCRADEEGILEVDEDFQTTVPGVYAAGDITPGSRLAIRAAYEGSRAAVGIHHDLIPPERRV